MTNKIKEIAVWLLDQSVNITRDVLEEKLMEAYNQGRMDGYQEKTDKTLENIRHNTLLEVRRRKQVLYENNFYNKPSEEAVTEMKALEYIEGHISEIVNQYRES